MRYEKPQFVVAPAHGVIHGGDKASSETLDMSVAYTIGAYEADE